MIRQVKKAYIEAKLKEEGERRSYNEISADLELRLWRAKFQGITPERYQAVVRELAEYVSRSIAPPPEEPQA